MKRILSPLLATVALTLLACSPSSIPGKTATPLEHAHGFGNYDVAGTLGTRTTIKTVTSNGVHVPVQLPDSVTNTSYWTVASTASANSTAIDTSGYAQACFTITELSTGTPVGTFQAQWSIDGTNWHTIFFDSDPVSGSVVNASLASDGLSFTVSSPGGPVVIGFCTEGHGALLRLVYMRTSGGTPNGITAIYSLRGVS